MSRMTVQLAYKHQEGSIERVITDSLGNVFNPRTNAWEYPPEQVKVTLLPGSFFDRWFDVPASWCGVQPYWR